MRRLLEVTLAALALGALLAGAAAFGPEFRSAARLPGGLAARITARTVSWAERIVLPVAVAQAQEVLDFKSVPAESAAAGEARKPGATEPEEPAVPAPPEPPERSRGETIHGKSGDIMRIGSDVHVVADQVITGDLLTVGGDITVDGHVEGDVVALGGDVRLNATARVDGDVASIGGQLSEEPGAFVGGQRVTASGLRGIHSLHRGDLRRALWGFTRTGHILSSMTWLLIMLLVAWGLVKLAPTRSQAALDTLHRETALSLGIGALVWALIIPSIVALALVVAILCITIIGIPLALAALLGYAVFLGLLEVWGYVIGVLGIGELVARRTAQRAAAAAGAPAMGGGAAVMAAPAGFSLARKAVLGVLVVSGAGLAGEVLQSFFFLPPVRGLGVFVSVLSTVAGGLAATFGSGALLRSEIRSGTLRRWWSGRKSAPAAGPAPAAAPGAAPGSGADPFPGAAPAAPPPEG